MASIFVSYRRSDAPGHAGRLYDRLAERFGEANVFKDLDSIKPGARFGQVIADTIARCDALIAVIGKDWLTSGPKGTPRIHDPDDWVRLEIASALRRDVRVVPVLVEGASLPPSASLPEDLKPLSERHAVALNEDVWRLQVTQLLDSFGPAPRDGSGERVTPTTMGTSYEELASRVDQNVEQRAREEGTRPQRQGDK